MYVKLVSSSITLGTLQKLDFKTKFTIIIVPIPAVYSIPICTQMQLGTIWNISYNRKPHFLRCEQPVPSQVANTYTDVRDIPTK